MPNDREDPGAKPQKSARRPGRPVGPDGRSQRVQVRIPQATLERLDDRAESEGRGRSAVIVDAVLDYLAR